MDEIQWRTRWSSDQVRTMLLEQFQAFWQRETGVESYHLAELLRGADTPQAIVISGLRRAGKSTLLAQRESRVPSREAR